MYSVRETCEILSQNCEIGRHRFPGMNNYVVGPSEEVQYRNPDISPDVDDDAGGSGAIVLPAENLVDRPHVVCMRYQHLVASKGCSQRCSPRVFTAAPQISPQCIDRLFIGTQRIEQGAVVARSEWRGEPPPLVCPSHLTIIAHRRTHPSGPIPYRPAGRRAGWFRRPLISQATVPRPDPTPGRTRAPEPFSSPNWTGMMPIVKGVPWFVDTFRGLRKSPL